MAKAVLVMDMPERCADCPLSCPLRNSPHAKNSYACCYLTLKDISKTDYYDKKPDWCPLRELPEYKKQFSDNGNTIEKNAGFNECLDKILGKE